MEFPFFMGELVPERLEVLFDQVFYVLRSEEQSVDAVDRQVPWKLGAPAPLGIDKHLVRNRTIVVRHPDRPAAGRDIQSLNDVGHVADTHASEAGSCVRPAARPGGRQCPRAANGGHERRVSPPSPVSSPGRRRLRATEYDK